MFTFFDYCFYRIAMTRFYQKQPYPYLWASGIVSTTECFLILAMINVCHAINDMTFDIKPVIYSLFIAVFFVNDFFIQTEKKYKKLKIRYRNEKHKILKGWGVVFYIVGSTAVFVLSVAFYYGRLEFHRLWRHEKNSYFCTLSPAR